MKRVVCRILLAASLAPLSVAAQSPRADGLTLSVETRAQDLYQSGRDHFRAGEFEDAESDFRRSLDLVDSPNTRMYLGRSLLRLDRLPEAYVTLDRAASDADRRSVAEPRYAATRDSARSEADEIRSGLALLTVHVSSLPEGATLRVGGAEVPRTAVGVPLPFRPGEVLVEFDAPGYAPAREVVVLSPGGASSVDLEPRVDPAAPRAPVPAPEGARPSGLAARVLAPPPTRWTGPRVAGVTLLSVGAATALTGLVFGVLAWTEHSALTDRGDGVHDAALIDQGEMHRDLANVLLGSGAAIAASGLITYLVGGRSAESTARPTAVQIDLGLGATGAVLRVGGAL